MPMGAHGLYTAAIFFEELAAEVEDAWLYELLRNLGRDAQNRAQNKLGMYQPPENIAGYTFPAWAPLDPKYKEWKMSKVGMESPGIMRGIMSGSIDYYVIPEANEVVIGSKEDYAYFFELGTHGNAEFPGRPPRPFMAPAVLEATQAWIGKAYAGEFLTEEGGGPQDIPMDWSKEEPSEDIIDERGSHAFTTAQAARGYELMRQAITGRKGPVMNRAFLGAVVERVFPGVRDVNVPTDTAPQYTGYVLGRLPGRFNQQDYRGYLSRLTHERPDSILESPTESEMAAYQYLSGTFARSPEEIMIESEDPDIEY